VRQADVRRSSLKQRPGKDVGFNGIEVAIDDTTGAAYHDTGALYDLVKPSKAMRSIATVGLSNVREKARLHRFTVTVHGSAVTGVQV
jgi:hypothetical protein